MDNLRLALIVIGAVLIVSIYLWGTYRKRQDFDLSQDDYDGDDDYDDLPDGDWDYPLRDPDAPNELNGLQDKQAANNVRDHDVGALHDVATDERPHGHSLGLGPSRPVYGDEDISDTDDEDDDDAVTVLNPDVRARREDATHPKLSDATYTADPTPPLDKAPEPQAVEPSPKTYEQLELGDLSKVQTASDGGWVKSPRPTNGREHKEDEEELVVVLNVMAQEGEAFAGPDIRRAMKKAGLEHGDMDIFHYQDPGTRRGSAWFSAANVLSPGTFDMETIDDLSTKGIAVFMMLPGPENPVAAFERMVKSAREIGDVLQGALCDESRSALTPQSINHLRERIADFGRRRRLRS